MSVFENKVLRGIFEPKRDEATAEGKKYIRRSLIICTRHLIMIGDQIEKNEVGWSCSTYGREEMCIQGLSEET